MISLGTGGERGTWIRFVVGGGPRISGDADVTNWSGLDRNRSAINFRFFFPLPVKYYEGKCMKIHSFKVCFV